jgi:hypothetical protein
MSVTDDSPETLVEEDIIINKEDSDYIMPLTQEEVNDLRFALELAMIRANSEQDRETLNKFGKLYNRIDYDGLIEQ